jgi:hypothetical protein
MGPLVIIERVNPTQRCEYGFESDWYFAPVIRLVQCCCLWPSISLKLKAYKFLFEGLRSPSSEFIPVRWMSEQTCIGTECSKIQRLAGWPHVFRWRQRQSLYEWMWVLVLRLLSGSCPSIRLLLKFSVLQYRGSVSDEWEGFPLYLRRF